MTYCQITAAERYTLGLLRRQGLTPAVMGAMEEPVQHAMASWRSRLARSIREVARKTQSMTTITAEIVAMAQGDGGAQLITLASGTTISRQSSTPRFHGRSWQRRMYSAVRIPAWSPP